MPKHANVGNAGGVMDPPSRPAPTSHALLAHMCHARSGGSGSNMQACANNATAGITAGGGYLKQRMAQKHSGCVPAGRRAGEAI